MISGLSDLIHGRTPSFLINGTNVPDGFVSMTAWKINQAPGAANHFLVQKNYIYFIINFYLRGEIKENGKVFHRISI